MNKIIKFWCVCLSLFMLIGAPVYGFGDYEIDQDDSFLEFEASLSKNWKYVADSADILTSEEEAELEEKAAQISEAYESGVYVVTVKDYRDYRDFSRRISGLNEVENAAALFYNHYDLGCGEDRDGTILLLSMEDRDYALLSHGFGKTAFTDAGREWVISEFKDDFRRNDWDAGLEDFLDGSNTLLKMARNGRPMSSDSTPAAKRMGYAISFLISGLIAILIGWKLRKSMQSVREKRNATEYVPQNGIRMDRREDIYVNTTVTRTKRSSSSSSGGGGSHSGGGFSGSSGKF